MEFTPEQQKLIASLPPLPAEIVATEIDQEISQYESTNEELKQDVPENVEFSLPDIPANASKEERLELLKKTNEVLVGIVNAPDEQPQKRSLEMASLCRWS